MASAPHELSLTDEVWFILVVTIVRTVRNLSKFVFKWHIQVYNYGLFSYIYLFCMRWQHVLDNICWSINNKEIRKEAQQRLHFRRYRSISDSHVQIYKQFLPSGHHCTKLSITSWILAYYLVALYCCWLQNWFALRTRFLCCLWMWVCAVSVFFYYFSIYVERCCAPWGRASPICCIFYNDSEISILFSSKFRQSNVQSGKLSFLLASASGRHRIWHNMLHQKENFNNCNWMDSMCSSTSDGLENICSVDLQTCRIMHS